MYLLFLILISIFEIVLGIVVFRKNRSRINVAFAAVVLLAFIWSIVNYFADNPIDPSLALLWNKLVFMAAFLQGAFLFYFASLFPFGYRKLERISVFILLPLGGILAILSVFTNLIVDRIEFFDWGTNVEPGALYGSFIGFMSITVVGMLVVLIIKYRHSAGLEKYQLKYLFSGFLLTALITLTTNLFLPLATGNNQLAKFGPLSMVFLIASTVYAIIKHRLMDIRIVLKKIVLHLLISLTLLTFILSAIFTVAYFYSKRIPDFSLVYTGSIAMVIALLFFKPLNSLFERIANKYFFTSLYNYQATLENLATKLTAVIEMPKVIDLIVDTIMKTMGLDRAGVLLLSNERNANRYVIAKVIGFDEQNGISLVRDNFLVQWLTSKRKIVVYEEIDWQIEESRGNGVRSDLMRLKANMKKIEASLCIPLFSKDSLISIIVLGNKVTKDAYNAEDFRLLQSIANQASVAIENARLYKQVQDFSKNLQTKVSEQTRDITAKNVQLEKLLKAQSEFLDIASHQLRTPVSVIRGIISMIQDGDMKRLPRKKQKEFIESAAQKGTKLDQIINDILAASELDSQKFTVDSKTPKINLESVVDQAVKGFQLEAEQRGIDLRWKPPKTPVPQVVGNDSMLEQAITNFVSNALKYTPSTKMSKEARAKRKAKGRVRVEIKHVKNDIVVQVQDNGIGIPKEEVKKL
ncbi:MAG: histidine kinase dimerization/phospho-acceptor domain-containing protein, partial [Bacteroidota bacterium]